LIDLRDADAPRSLPYFEEPQVTLQVRTLRQVRLAAVTLLVMLNVADLVTTRMFLNRGLEEGNGLSWILIQHGTMPWIKSALLLALAWRALKSVPTFGATCAMWFVVGLYAMTITVNCLALASL
jgi:hypothetical protein